MHDARLSATSLGIKDEALKISGCVTLFSVRFYIEGPDKSLRHGKNGMRFAVSLLEGKSADYGFSYLYGRSPLETPSRLLA